MSDETTTQKDMLIPLSEFEKQHNIQTTREDLPYQFLGRCPSKYYKIVDMDVEALFKKVKKLFERVYKRSF